MVDKNPKPSDDKRRQTADRIADSLKEAERRKEEIKFQEEWNKRIDIAREGRVAYEGEDPVLAVVNYKKILTLTARRHNVPLEQLHPKLFDSKTRVSECLLISAICLDLAKIIERLEGESAKRDLKVYLRLFVIFSKGMPFEVVATSTLRKYMQYTRGLKNRAVFEDTYNQLKKGACFVASAAFGDEDAPPLETLRRFRDEILRESKRGRALVDFYYMRGPALATAVTRLPGAATCVRILVYAALPLVSWMLERRRIS